MPSDLPVPAPGDWPCQHDTTHPAIDHTPRLVTFLYLLARDGAKSPGDVEQLAINATDSDASMPAFTNPHLEQYARALTAHLLEL